MTHGLFADVDQFSSAFEIVEFESGNIGLDYQIGRFSPAITHPVLRDGKRLPNHIEEMPRRGL